MRYLYRRKEGGNYYVRLQPTGQKLVERSLGTSDLKAAEIAAADLIKQHKAFMYQRRQVRVARVVHGPWAHEYAPGLHTLPNGGHVMATETDLTFSDGTRRPNGGPAIYLTGAPLSAAREFQAFDDAYDGKIGEGPVEDQRPKFVAAKSSADDALLETYIKHKGITGYREREAREAWRMPHTASHIKPWRKCSNKERLDPQNGLLLTTHIDALFDCGLISFQDDGNILISDKVPSHETERLNLGSGLRKAPTPALKHFLSYHRRYVARGVRACDARKQIHLSNSAAFPKARTMARLCLSLLEHCCERAA